MNANSQATAIFCSYLCLADGVEPLTPAEWSALAEKLMTHKLEPRDILNFSAHDLVSELEIDSEYAERMLRLTDRSAGLFSEINRYENEGIRIFTRADSEYPARLKRKLGQKCPPMFYCSGDIKILELKVMGYAGSRKIDEDDERFTRLTAKKTCSHRLGVVSGGAKGVDSVAAETAFAEGWPVVEFIAGDLAALIKKRDIKSSLADGKRLLLSEVIPSAGFSVGAAMSRNKYIYAQAEAAVIVKSDFAKGGTWAGATENLKHKWCKLFCRDIDYPGNRELIRAGAAAINENWDGDAGKDYTHAGQIEISFTE